MQQLRRLTIRNLVAILAMVAFLVPPLTAGDVPQEALDKIDKAIPAAATAKPAAPRRVLVFNLSLGFRHGAIPYGAAALQRMGKATGAYEAVLSDDLGMFDAESLAGFDAVVFNNTTGELFADETRRANLMAFVKEGKGIVGIHAATDCCYEWAEFGEMMGGYFDGHPWNERVTIRIEDPTHPVNSAFIGRAFAVADEIYQFKAPYSRDNLRVLLSLDTDKTNMDKGGIRRDDRDFAVSWVRSLGKGRVFYCSLGHRNEIFWNPTILRHYLDGIQFALGDLEADTTPSAKLARGGVATAGSGDVWTAATAYEEGQSRLPLTAIQGQVRKAMGDGAARTAVVVRLLALAGNEEATVAGRAFACRQLALVGGDESVPTLAVLLHHEELSHMARFALQGMPSDAAGAALRAALHDLNDAQFIGLLNTLGERRDATAAAIVGAMLDGLEGDARTAAIEMLGKVGNEKAAEILLGQWASALEAGKDGAALERLPDAILRCADGLARDGRTDAALGIYGMIYYRPHPRHLRIAGFTGMVRADPVETAGDVVRALGDADPVWRGVAAGLIRQVPGRAATVAFAKGLATATGEARLRLVQSLAVRGDRLAAPAVAALVKSPDAALSAAAIAALGSIGDASSVALLAELAVGGSEEARRSLRSLPGDDVNETIADLITDGKPSLRIELARTLGARRAKAQAPTLLALLATMDNPIVRIAAYEALGVVAGPEHLFTLVQLLALATDTNEIAAGIDCVTATCLRIDDPEKRARPLVSTIGHCDEVGKVSLLRVLGRIGGESALAAVRSALADGDAGAAAATAALANWPDATAAEGLLEIARGTQDPAQRAAAFTGFVRTASMPGDRTPEGAVALYRAAFELAANDEMKKDALAGIAHVAHPDALALAEGQLGNATLRHEAALAMIAIAKATGDGNYETALGAVERAMAACPDDADVKREAGVVINHVERNADYITAWRFAGPYVEKDVGSGALFDVAFPPEPGGPGGEIAWREIPDAARVAPGIVDFMKFAGGNERCCYLVTEITSPTAQKARLELGSDDGIKVWMNGEVVHANNAMRGLTLGSDVVTVDLKEGANALVLKITQGAGDWSAACRLRSVDGYHLPGVKVSVPE